jgi:hypothetical protein
MDTHVKIIAIIANTPWKEIVMMRTGFQFPKNNTEKSLDTKIQLLQWKTKCHIIGLLFRKTMILIMLKTVKVKMEEVEIKVFSLTNLNCRYPSNIPNLITKTLSSSQI